MNRAPTVAIIKIRRLVRRGRLAERPNCDFHFGAVGEINVLEGIENAAAKARLYPPRTGVAVGRSPFRVRRGWFGNASRLIESFVRERVGFAILLAINMFYVEGLEPLRHFLGAFEQRPQVFALHFV